MSNNQSNIDWDLIGRINEIRHDLSITQGKLAEVVEASQGNISDSLTGKRGIPKVWLYKILSQYPKINEKWLWEGKGEKYTSEENSGLEQQVMEDTRAYIKGKQLSKDDLEKVVMWLVFRVEQLEAWKQEVEARQDKSKKRKSARLFVHK